MTSLYAVGIKGQRPWAAGALLLEGDDWRRDAALWQCDHRHEDPHEAMLCAQAELDRRAAAGEQLTKEQTMFGEFLLSVDAVESLQTPEPQPVVVHKAPENRANTNRNRATVCGEVIAIASQFTNLTWALSKQYQVCRSCINEEDQAVILSREKAADEALRERARAGTFLNSADRRVAMQKGLL